MTSERPGTAFVWVWLPGREEPVVAGRVDEAGPFLQFTYGRRYLERGDAVPLYLPELPLQPGPQRPPAGFDAHGCLRDAGPDAWGQRVILHRMLGGATRETDTDRLSLLTYLLAAGSDRIGALDFQASPESYEPRTASAPLEDLIDAADRVEAGEPLPETLEQALLQASSVGGARPKALLDDDGRPLIAKLASPSDAFPWVPAEAVAMELAGRAGLDVASTRRMTAMGRDVLLVDRFDRVGGTHRRMVVSALTVLGLHEMQVRWGSYAELADIIRRRFTAPRATLRELFTRIVFNVLVGNTDDHPRNHAAFWDGEQLTLTPAFDIAPQPRSGGEAAQAMAIGPADPSDPDPTSAARLSKLSVCLDAAATYQLDAREAHDIVDRLVTVVHDQWQDACETVGVAPAVRDRLWGREVCNPFVFEG